MLLSRSAAKALRRLRKRDWIPTKREGGRSGNTMRFKLPEGRPHQIAQCGKDTCSKSISHTKGVLWPSILPIGSLRLAFLGFFS